MSGDEDRKLPAVQRAAVPATGHEPDQLLTPPARGGLVGRLVGRWLARDVAETVKADTSKLEAMQANLVAHRGVYDAAGNLAEAREAFLYKTPARIREVQKDTDHWEAEQDDRRARERALSRQATEQAQAGTMAGRLEAEHAARVTEQRQQAELWQVRHETNRQQLGHDAYQQSMPDRLQRSLETVKKGQYDVETDRLDAEVRRHAAAAGLQEYLSSGAPAGPAGETGEATMLRGMLAELDQQIELQTATHASPDQLQPLYEMRARLAARLDVATKNRPG